MRISAAWRITAGLAVVALVLSAVFTIHGVATGLGVPYPDPTPQQAAFVRYHWGISNVLFFTTGVGWLLAGSAAVWAGLQSRWNQST